MLTPFKCLELSQHNPASSDEPDLNNIMRAITSRFIKKTEKKKFGLLLFVESNQAEGELHCFIVRLFLGKGIRGSWCVTRGWMFTGNIGELRLSHTGTHYSPVRAIKEKKKPNNWRMIHKL